MPYKLDEIKKGMADTLILLKENLKGCERRIDEVDEQMKELQKVRDGEVKELNEIRDMIRKLEK